MRKRVTTEGSFVFRERDDGELEFIGDFDGLYRNEKDPWAQSGNDDQWVDYYNFSRGNIVKAIDQLSSTGSLVEIGCGIGFVTDFIAQNLPGYEVDGMDISSVAVERASEKFPKYNFMSCDIGSRDFGLVEKYDVVLLNQLLWYILQNLETAISNCHKLIKSGGYLVISQSFLREKQRYGSDIVEGCEGLSDFIAKHHQAEFSLLKVHYDETEEFIHHDGLLIYKKLEA